MSKSLIFLRSWMDERKVDWATFATTEGKEVTIGVPSELFVSLEKQYGCDLEMVCRLGLEALDEWPKAPTLVEGRAYARLEQAFKKWEFRIGAVEEDTSTATLEEAISTMRDHYNGRYGEGWEYFYLKERPHRFPSENLQGVKLVFRRRKSV